MKMSKHSRKRLIGVCLTAWMAALGFDFLLHGGLLASLYIEPSPFLLPPEQAFRLIPLGYAAFLVFTVFLMWLMLRLEILGWKPGLVFGLQVGAFTWISMALGLLSISTASPALIVSWGAGQMVEAGITGLVIASGLETNRPWRLFAYVLAFVFTAIAITIVLQSTGLAPVTKMALIYGNSLTSGG